MSYYRRGYNWEQIHYIPAPVQGWNPDANPWEIGAEQAAALDNFLLRPGKIVVRGGFNVLADLSASAPLGVCGYVASGRLLLARKAVSSTATVDPWNAPVLGTAAAVLAAGQTTMDYVTNSNGTITPVNATSADQIVGPRWINFDGLRYGISYDSAGSAIQDASSTYFMKPVSLLSLASVQQAQNNSATASTGTVANNGSGVAWSNLSGAVSGNPATPATVTTSAGGTAADNLYLSGLGFAVPAGAVVTGVGVQITMEENGTQASEFFPHLYLTKDGSTFTGDHFLGTTPSTWTQIGVGSSSDMWGATLSPADVNNGAFGILLWNTSYQGATGSGTLSVDSIIVTVYWTVPATSAPLPTVLSNAPHGAFDLKGYQSRIWLLAGVDTPGAGTTHSCTSVFFTNPIVAGGGSASADWRDPVSGLTNVVKMDNNSQDYGVALATVRNGLLILRRSSLWLLRGSTTANYVMVPVSREVGCLDARSVVEADSGVYFLSQKGLMLTDGTRVTNVSGACTYTLQQAIVAEQQSVLSGHGGYISCGLTSQGQVLVSIGAVAGGNHLAPIWCGLYDPSVKGGAWVRVTSQLWASDGNQVGTNYYPGQIIWQQSPHMVYAVGDKYVTQLEDAIQNYSFLSQTQLYDQLPSGVSPFLSIPATWKTRFAPIVGTTTLARKFGQAKRFFMDYVFAGAGIVPATGWSATPVDSTDTAYAAPLAAALGSVSATTGSVSGVTAVASPTIQRQNADFANEISDLGFDIVWSDATARSVQPSPALAEIYGIGVEFQPTRDLR